MVFRDVVTAGWQVAFVAGLIALLWWLLFRRELGGGRFTLRALFVFLFFESLYFWVLWLLISGTTLPF
jgi:hypothetical protein